MRDGVRVRAEQPGEAEVVAGIVRRAYANVAHSDHREPVMIERLRRTDAFVPALSLVATRNGEPVGHLLLTRAEIRGERTVPTLALAPLSVVPEHQHRGIGTALVAAAHARAAALGYGSILLVGMPAYYARFGYEPLGRYPITLPFDVPDAQRMILPLRRDALDGVAGIVAYAEGWLNH